DGRAKLAGSLDELRPVLAGKGGAAVGAPLLLHRLGPASGVLELGRNAVAAQCVQQEAVHVVVEVAEAGVVAQPQSKDLAHGVIVGVRGERLSRSCGDSACPWRPSLLRWGRPEAGG